tara:strand:- start:628 stop:1167 length:540 start_codon:yes stop_codon:yes gene_type:complete
MTTRKMETAPAEAPAKATPTAEDDTDRFSPQYLLNLLINVGSFLATIYDRRSPLTRQQTRVIGVLLAQDGQTQTELANALQIHKVSVGIYISELEKMGLVERRQHETDRRAKCIFLTKLLHATKHIGMKHYDTVHHIATEGIDEQAYLNMLDCIELMRTNLMTQDIKDRERSAGASTSN